MSARPNAIQRKRRHRRIRKKMSGSVECPRLCVFRSSRHIYAQLVDDSENRTLGSFSSLKVTKVKAEKEGQKTAMAREVGKGIAGVAKEKGIKKVRFDRGGFLYHGRVAALADEARKNGLEF